MSDRNYINAETLRFYCNTNEIYLDGKKPRGIVIEFPGLGGSSCLGGNIARGNYETDYAKKLADEGLILVYTFPGPWSWMNKGAVRISDLVIDAVMEKYGLSQDCPIVATGGSMGGLGAIIFCADTRHKISACAAACPCYDALRFFGANDDFPRTFISAIAGYDMSFEDGLAAISPAHRMDELAKIPYLILCDELDECFEAEGMKVFAEELRKKVGDVEFLFEAQKEHGGFIPEDREYFTEYVIAHCK